MRVVGRNSRRRALWLCNCSCGRSTIVAGVLLRNGETKSCGCLRSTVSRAKALQHGATQERSMTVEYRCWLSMRSRCLNPRHKDWLRYGGVGITIASRWDSFKLFLDDLGPRPSLAHSLDRIDGSRGYEPGNVRWATKKEQAQNSANAHFIEWDGKKMTVGDWARHLGMPASTLSARLQRGWPIERALAGVRDEER